MIFDKEIIYGLFVVVIPVLLIALLSRVTSVSVAVDGVLTQIDLLHKWNRDLRRVNMVVSRRFEGCDEGI